MSLSKSCTGVRMLLLFVSTMQPLMSISSKIKCAYMHHKVDAH